MDKLELPQLREQLLSALGDLSDESYQRRVWLEGENNPVTGEPSSFQWSQEVLYDYQDFRERNACVGSFLYNEGERQVLVELLDTIDALGLSGDEPDEKVLSHSDWHKVIGAARKAYAALKAEDEKHAAS